MIKGASLPSLMGSMLIILLKLCPPEAARIQVPPHGIDFRDEAANIRNCSIRPPEQLRDTVANLLLSLQ
jgi:hypothetical protein